MMISGSLIVLLSHFSFPFLSFPFFPFHSIKHTMRCQHKARRPHEAIAISYLTEKKHEHKFCCSSHDPELSHGYYH